MTYEEFKTAIIGRMESLIPEGASMQIRPIRKNNGILLDGLIISSSKSNISPTIFLNYYYEKQSLFADFDAICRDIMLTYTQNMSPSNVDISFFTDYDLVKNRIAYRLIHYAKNKELLKTVPYIRYLDLAIVFYYLLELPENGNATILINHKHLKLWHISAAELHEQCCLTTPLLLPYDFRNMAEVLSGVFDSNLSPNGDITRAASSFCPMYVLTNSRRLYGASCMLYPRLLEQIAGTLGADLFILPSSVHETILLPAANRSHHEELVDMVTDINQTELAPEDVLSSHVYYYSKSEQALSMC